MSSGPLSRRRVFGCGGEPVGTYNDPIFCIRVRYALAKSLLGNIDANPYLLPE